MRVLPFETLCLARTGNILVDMDKDQLNGLFPPGALDGIVDGPAVPEKAPFLPETRQVWQVSELISSVMSRLEMEFDLLWIEGEISNLSRPVSGHLYFSLKDERAQIRAVIFKRQAERSRFRLENGQHVACLGRLNVYPARGDLQLVVNRIEPWGYGALHLAFEQLKVKLKAEGLFDQKHKRPLPLLPNRVFLITSPSGAAVTDFVKTARSRYPGANIILCPARVQGEVAPDELIRGLQKALEVASERDVIVIARGGGSIEDLWAFNNEALAREIFKAHIPVVSAVGHEIDFSICDFVADHRAATPTAAANLVFPELRILKEKIHTYEGSLKSAFQETINLKRRRSELLRLRMKTPGQRLTQQRMRLDDLLFKMNMAMTQVLGSRSTHLGLLLQRLERGNPSEKLIRSRSILDSLDKDLKERIKTVLGSKRHVLGIHGARLEGVSPLSCLGRGYSLVYRAKEDHLVRSADQVKTGDNLLIRPARGQILCKVTETMD